MDKELDERFAILSPTVRQLLSGDSIPTLAGSLAEKHGLDEEMRNGIETEIALILMYIEPYDDFGSTLMTEYLVPPEAALDIEKEVTSTLFTPLISELGKRSDLPDDEDHVTAEEAATIAETETPIILKKPITLPTTEAPPSPAPQPIPAMRVMPQNVTELPSSLLHNLKASLAHSEPLPPYVEQPTPKASYNSLLETTPQPSSTPVSKPPTE